MDEQQIREVLAEIRRDAENDPSFKAEALANMPKIMRERGLNLDDIVTAHDMARCPACSLAGRVTS